MKRPSLHRFVNVEIVIMTANEPDISWFVQEEEESGPRSRNGSESDATRSNENFAATSCPRFAFTLGPSCLFCVFDYRSEYCYLANMARSSKQVQLHVRSTANLKEI